MYIYIYIYITLNPNPPNATLTSMPQPPTTRCPSCDSSSREWEACTPESRLKSILVNSHCAAHPNIFKPKYPRQTSGPKILRPKSPRQPLKHEPMCHFSLDWFVLLVTAISKVLHP